MDNHLMIKRLTNVGIPFETGLQDEEFQEIETVFGFRFPAEIKSFLSCGLPVGKEFFNWRDLSPANIEKFHSFSRSIEKSFLFDIENNSQELASLLGEKFSNLVGTDAFKEAVLDYFHRSIKLIPFYAHRCFFDGMDHMPIVSFWQPVDTIIYGTSFETYLKTEFLGEADPAGHIPEEMQQTGIWYDLIE